MTVASSRRLDAFDQWCLRRIVHSIYGAYSGISPKLKKKWGVEQLGQPPVTSVIATRRHRLFGSCESRPSQDHSRILRAAINRPPADWRRRSGRPRWTWLRTIKLDLRPHNLGLNTAWMRVQVQDRSKWRQLVETAMLTDWWVHYSMMMMMIRSTSSKIQEVRNASISIFRTVCFCCV